MEPCPEFFGIQLQLRAGFDLVRHLLPFSRRYSMFRCISVVLAATGLAVAASQSTYPTEIPGVHLQADPGVYGPALQIVHLYYDQFPTGRNS